ncbi:MAG: alpha/beta hydrolase, partial [Maribacter sp.]|nr:alpha/beta hydrolase [Maribacter sp.]
VPDSLITKGKFTYGYMKVPELHSKPNGKAIELAVAVFKSQADAPTHEPLVLVTGGPGMSDIDAFIPLMIGDLGKLFLDNRDVVIIELRGLKYSKPNLLSPEIEALQMSLLDKNYTADETLDVYMDTLKETYTRFETEGVNLSAFNDYEIAKDIVFVMEQLGHDSFAVFGSSFGTLVCQHLLLNHSDHITSVTMNAVVDMNKAFPGMHTNANQTLEALFEKCRNDKALSKAYPDLKNRFLSTIKRLNEHPDTLQINYPKDKKMYKLVLNGNKLAVWIFADMYWDTQLPATLHKLLSGDYGQIEKSPGILFPSDDFSHGLSLSIILSEFANFEKDNIPLDDEYAEFVKGSGTLIFTPHFLNRAKKVWKVSDLQNKHINLVSDVPTLMLSGELDHVCPPRYTTELSKKLKNSYGYIFPGIAHSPIEQGGCGIMMMKEFIDDPTKAPNSECMAQFESGYKTP